MSQSFRCGKCGTLLEADTRDVGQPVECPECGYGFQVPQRMLGPGVKLGGFQIESLLGRGGMGEVYLARQLSMDRQVALKVLPSHLTSDPSRVQRFLSEVRNSARLDHPNIVSAHEAGEDHGVYYLAMTYVRGESIERRLKREGTLSEGQALGIVRKMAAALGYAWTQHRMLHRDIKPANIMLDQAGEPRLLDMGLAKSLNDQVHLTMSSASLMGTPNYMAPEQAEGRMDLDFRADIYALGATLYHMLTGEIPFAGSSIVEVLRKQISEKLPDPRTRNPGVSEATVVLLERMLAKKREKRPESWEALIGELDRVIRGRKPEAKRLEPGESMMLSAADLKGLQGAAPKRSVGKLLVHVRHGHVVGGESPTAEPAKKPEPVPPAPAKKAAPEAAKLKRIALIGGAAAAAILVAGVAVKLGTKDGGAGKTEPPRPPTAAPAPADAFAREIAALPPGEQVIRVAKKLKELNPGYDGRIGYKSEAAMLKVSDPASTNLAPLRALPWLKELVCDPAALATPATLGALRSLPALATINGAPAAEAWKKVAAAGLPSAVDEAFLREVAALPAEEQVRRVVAKLKELNPGFDGKEVHQVKDGRVDTLGLISSELSSIAPVAALKKLEFFGCGTTVLVHSARAKLTDLSPLKGLPLKVLQCPYTSVRDLSPLQGMPLLQFSCNGTPVSDLSPLRGMPVLSLNCQDTEVRDLSVLRDMPLQMLFCDPAVATGEANRAVLGSMRSLEAINNVPVAEFWKQADAGKLPTAAAAPGSGTSAEGWTTLPNGWRFGKPVNLGPGLNSAASEGRPCVSADGLTLLFGSDRPSKNGMDSIWVATRRSPAEAWSAPTRLDPPVNSSNHDSAPCLSQESLTLYFASNRPGGQGRIDLWMSTRRSTADTWGTPENLGPTVNSSADDSTPAVSTDGLTLIFASGRTGGEGQLDLWMSTRAKVTGPWGTPVNLGAPVNTKAWEESPSLSADGLTLFFISDRPATRGGHDLWMSTRRSRTEPFGEPVNLGSVVNTPSHDAGPALAADSHTLYFCSTRPGGQGATDLWQVPVLPPGTDDADWKNVINLLPLIDLPKDAITGEWTMVKGELVGDQDNYARIQIPYQPPEEYDYRVEFTIEGPGENGPIQLLAKAGREFRWQCFAGKTRIFGFDMVGGKSIQETPARTAWDMPLIKHRRCVSLVEVRKGTIRGYFNGQLVVEWKTDYTDMDIAPKWKLHSAGVVGVGCQHRTVFHRIEVREVTGKGTFTRAAPAAAKAGEK